MRSNSLNCIIAFLLAAGFSTAPARAADPFNPTPATLKTPGDDTSFQRLTVDSGGKTPTFKKIDPAWAKSLADRGEPIVYTKDNSKNFTYLGMPIGGIGAGELYLGGDGKLWEWDIFNTRNTPGFPVEGGGAYEHPHTANAANDPFQTVLQQGFVLSTKSDGKTDVRTLDKDGFADVKFKGQYPIGYVDFADPACPVHVSLEAFSPYDPGNVADSTYPATILNYTLTNTSKQSVECTLGGWLENGGAPLTRLQGSVSLEAQAAAGAGYTLVSENVNALELKEKVAPPEMVDDFESGTYADWAAEGTAFGSRPAKGNEFGHGTPVVGIQGGYFVDSFLNGQDKDTGTLTSKPFVISRPYLTLLVGGGNAPGKECVNLLIDGQTVDTATGNNTEILQPVAWDMAKFKGKSAQLQIVDASTEGWGHIMVDNIAQRDSLVIPIPIGQQADVGSMALTALGGGKADVVAQVTGPDYAHALLEAPASESAHLMPKTGMDKMVSGLRRHLTLAPGQQATLSFAVTWYFPNPLALGLHTSNSRQYGVRFKSAADVAAHIAADFKRLAGTTRLWHDTFYSSTLPWWFLDRTFLNTSTLATSTAYLLADGRFYGYEGRYSCPGTCTHVWGYQPAIGFLFPDLDKSVMEKVEFVPGLGMNPAGGVAMRGEFDQNPPVDGQAGIILRTYLAHKMSGDDAFLKRNYASVKMAMDYLVNTFDKAQEGILIGAQANTMDAAWFGKIPWLSLHYQAALRAMAEMADDTGDHDYATKLRGIADKGREFIETKLWNGEYFFHEADPAQPNSPGTYAGCPIEQLMGQSWAYDVGLGDIIDPQKANTAIDSMWKYNYTTDAGAYRKAFPDGRWYAMAGEPGLIMCSWPNGSADALEKGNRGFSAYDNECWTGSEHEITTAMMGEGQVDKALAEERTVNDRYNGAVRNPWDECECGSHYSRAMSSYGVYVAACGYEYDGPKGTMAFAPRVNPDHFQGAFTAAEGWGSFRQKADASGFTAALDLRHGRLALKQLALVLPAGKSAAHATATVAGKSVPVTSTLADRRVTLAFPQGLRLTEGQTLEVALR
jgi:non-lysosomal glucosylceramidase